MGLGEKVKLAAAKVSGKGKEAAGEAAGNDRLKAEGKTEHAKAELKQAADKAKGIFKKH
ncbi:CsbD family protein [Arthrobacter dokdonensis]|uniref:CsbD family protein n=1 Tax=Arthrobacter dokdonellae TaxID=2211210 RepID=UPI000DE5ABE6|nr:CsbD family protein [Arthrobacter dokdonellae]